MRKKVIWGLSALALCASTVLLYAAASYPSAVKSFTTKTDGPGQTIFAAHINDLQDEVVAVEGALLNGFAHLLKPLSDATYDLGTSSLKWRDFYLSRNATVGGTLGVTGVTTLTGASTHTGVATFTAQSVHNAGIDLSGAAAGQIVFPAAQHASANANTLDDYEEGTWTPADGSGATLAFTLGTCQYVKIGQLVVATASITYPATGSGAATLISGLPFTAQASPVSWGGQITYSDLGVAFYALVIPNTTTASFWALAGTAVVNSTLSAKSVRVTFTYRASA